MRFHLSILARPTVRFTLTMFCLVLTLIFCMNVITRSTRYYQSSWKLGQSFDCEASLFQGYGIFGFAFYTTPIPGPGDLFVSVDYEEPPNGIGPFLRPAEFKWTPYLDGPSDWNFGSPYRKDFYLVLPIWIPLVLLVPLAARSWYLFFTTPPRDDPRARALVASAAGSASAAAKT